MIDLIDDALREFLIRELPVRDSEIDISFEQPRRDWSARLSRPTLNIFLRDVRENIKLRAPQPGMQKLVNGNMAQLTRQAVRIDLHYFVTAWAKEPLDEHRILSRVLAALFRFRAIPEDILVQFTDSQESGVPLKLAQYENQQSAGDIWSVLDNDMRPAVDIVATISLQPYMSDDVPLVRELELTVFQRKSAAK